MRELEPYRFARIRDLHLLDVAVDIAGAPHDPVAVAAWHVQLHSGAVRAVKCLVHVHKGLHVVLAFGQIVQRGQRIAEDARITPSEHD
jgi:hypothetical protein